MTSEGDMISQHFIFYCLASITPICLPTAILAFCFWFWFFLCLFFRAACAAYGGSQARSQIRAASLYRSHSNVRSKLCLDLHHSSWQHWILNSLREARDRMCILMVPSWIRFHCATTGTPQLPF